MSIGIFFSSLKGSVKPSFDRSAAENIDTAKTSNSQGCIQLEL